LRHYTRPHARRFAREAADGVVVGIHAKFFHRSELIIMSSPFTRAGFGVVAAIALACVGCQEDNEAAIKQQEQKSAGADVKSATPQPTNADQRIQQNQNRKPTSKGMGYPGAKM
jgi:hypothetical protein